jgi:amino acid transporter
MIQQIRNKLLGISLILMACFAIMPATVFATPPPPTTVDIENATCTGGDEVKITADPSSHACDNIKDSGAKTASNLVTIIINILSSLVGILAVIMIIYAGFRYVTSGGKDDAVKGAKNTIVYAIIGLVLVALAQIIVHFVLDKTSQATNTPHCVKHKIDSGPDAGKACS